MLALTSTIRTKHMLCDAFAQFGLTATAIVMLTVASVISVAFLDLRLFGVSGQLFCGRSMFRWDGAGKCWWPAESIPLRIVCPKVCVRCVIVAGRSYNRSGFRAHNYREPYASVERPTIMGHRNATSTCSWIAFVRFGGRLRKNTCQKPSVCDHRFGVVIARTMGCCAGQTVKRTRSVALFVVALHFHVDAQTQSLCSNNKSLCLSTDWQFCQISVLYIVCCILFFKLLSSQPQSVR